MISQKKAGVILSYMAQLIQIITGLIYTPVMLSLLGQSEYGLYQLTYSVISYLSLLSLGFSAAYIRFYSRYKVSKKIKSIANLNGMFMTIFLVIAVIALVCGGIMTININSILGGGLSESELATAKVLMALMTFNLAISFPTSVFDCSIIAHERFVFQKLIIVSQYILNPFLTLPLLIMGYGSIAIVLISTLLSILKLIINMFYCFKAIHMKFTFNNFNFDLLKEMWVFTFFIFLNQIIDQVNWSIDKFLLGRIVGTISVAIYGLASTINTMYLQFSSSISNVFVPKVNMIVAKNDKNINKELTRLFTRVGRVQFIVLMLVITGFIFFGQSFISLWVGSEYKDSYYVALWLLIPVTIPLIQNLGLEIQRAKNMHRIRSIVYLFIAVGNVTISIPLIKIFGSVGAAIGTAISLFFGNIIFMNWYYHKKIKLDMIYFWKQIFRFLPALILPTILGVLIYRHILIAGWSKLFIWAFVYSLIYSFAMWFFGMNSYEKNIIKSLFLRKIVKVK